MKKNLKIILILTIVIACACSSKVEQGKVVGVKANMNFSEINKVEDATIYYDGKLIIEKADGEKINAFCDKSLVEHIKGGTQVEIIFDKKLDDWKVSKIIE